jgi:cyclomaltodextrinase / maltogenic alpha-amylase / neopullulanase
MSSPAPLWRALVAAFWASGAAAEDFAARPARPTAEWVKDAVIYEVFPRAFSPSGNFEGITARLDDLQKLGVTVLWLMPIHPVGREKSKGSLGSPYAVRDFYAINPDYGTAADLKRLVAESHRHGLRVIIDIVANHTAWDSVMMQHPEFYKKDAEGHIISPVPDWQDVAGLDYTSHALRAYMIDMLRYWLREFDLDGFRCDAAGMVPTDFWDEARAAIQAQKPDVMMLAEWHTPDLLLKAFELDYSWPLHATLTEVLQGRKPASALRVDWEQERRTYPQGALHLRFSDNHDERRAIGRFGERGAMAASAFMFTLDGVPLLYNGMEVGDTTESGAPALFERLPVFWPFAERRPELVRFYQALIAFRREHAALRRGSMTWISSSDEDRVLTYLRAEATEELLVAVNLSSGPFAGTVSLPEPRGFVDVTPAAEGPPVELASLRLGAWGFRIFRRSRP